MLAEYRSRAVRKILESFDLDRRPGYFKLRRYSRLLKRAEQLPEYKARTVCDITSGLGGIGEGSSIFLRHAKLQYQNNGETLNKPFEVPLVDQTGKINVLVNPSEPYRHPRFGAAPFPLAVVLEDIRFKQELKDITLVNREANNSLDLWSFTTRLGGSYYSGGGNGRRPQESWNRLKDAVEKLFPKPLPIPNF